MANKPEQVRRLLKNAQDTEQVAAKISVSVQRAAEISEQRSVAAARHEDPRAGDLNHWISLAYDDIVRLYEEVGGYARDLIQHYEGS
jgi:hypothetical protein